MGSAVRPGFRPDAVQRSYGSARTVWIRGRICSALYRSIHHRWRFERCAHL